MAGVARAVAPAVIKASHLVEIIGHALWRAQRAWTCRRKAERRRNCNVANSPENLPVCAPDEILLPSRCDLLCAIVNPLDSRQYDEDSADERTASEFLTRPYAATGARVVTIGTLASSGNEPCRPPKRNQVFPWALEPLT